LEVVLPELLGGLLQTKKNLDTLRELVRTGLKERKEGDEMRGGKKKCKVKFVPPH